jgi:hypothetical protein
MLMLDIIVADTDTMLSLWTKYYLIKLEVREDQIQLRRSDLSRLSWNDVAIVAVNLSSPSRRAVVANLPSNIFAEKFWRTIISLEKLSSPPLDSLRNRRRRHWTCGKIVWHQKTHDCLPQEGYYQVKLSTFYLVCFLVIRSNYNQVKLSTSDSIHFFSYMRKH